MKEMIEKEEIGFYSLYSLNSGIVKNACGGGMSPNRPLLYILYEKS